MRAADLPSFHDMRRRARSLLADARDELNSDWRPGTGPTDGQAEHWHNARRLIAQAKNELDRAAG